MRLLDKIIINGYNEKKWFLDSEKINMIINEVRLPPLIIEKIIEKCCYNYSRNSDLTFMWNDEEKADILYFYGICEGKEMALALFKFNRVNLYFMNKISIISEIMYENIGKDTVLLENGTAFVTVENNMMLLNIYSKRHLNVISCNFKFYILQVRRFSYNDNQTESEILTRLSLINHNFLNSDMFR